MSLYLQSSVSDTQKVKDLLDECGLTQYYERFADEGFDQLKSLFDITEADLSALGVKRGHRRLLQREISNRKGIPSGQPLLVDNSAFNCKDHRSSSTTSGYSSMASFKTGKDITGSVECSSSISSTEDDTSSSSPLQKRKYRRHAKLDKNAPIKPPSAYVMFSNDIRKELKDYNMSFTELARIVGNRWKNIDQDTKQRYEEAANKAKDDYLLELSEYQRTEEYKNYQKYITDFRSKQDAAARAVGRPRKRVKTESPSSGSIADSSSNGSGNSNSSSNGHTSNGNSSNGSSSNGHSSNCYNGNGYSTSNTSFSDSMVSETTPDFFTRKAVDVGLSSERLATQDAFYNRIAPHPTATPYSSPVSRQDNTPSTPSSVASEESAFRPARRPNLESLITQPDPTFSSEDAAVPGYHQHEKTDDSHKLATTDTSSTIIPLPPRGRRSKSFHLRR